MHFNFTDFHLSSEDNSAFIFMILLAIPFVLLFPIIVKFLRHLRIKKQIRSKIFISLYESPLKLSPAEIGYLYDTKISENELVGTFFDLEYREFISISNSGDIKIINNNEENLNKFEKYIFSLIKDGWIKSINKQFNPIIYPTFSAMVREKLILSGYMQRNLLSGFIKSVLKLTFSIYIGSIITFIIYWFASVFYYHAQNSAFSSYGILSFIILVFFTMFISLIYWQYYIIAGVVLTLIFIKINGTNWISTKQLKNVWNDIEGYKFYIQQAQLNRLQYDSKETKQASNEKDFAYAVALGMNISWKNRFK